MSNELPQNAAKVANDYLDRLSSRLTGMPLNDRREILDEIKSHIYDSYINEGAGDEIDRILTVLRRLGDPDDVISSRMPQAVGRLGKSKKAPMYILAGSLIALVGVPLGLFAITLLMGLMTALFALLVAFYGAGISLVVGGFLSSIICLVAATSPGILDRFNSAVGMEVLRIGPMPFVNDPQLSAIIALIISLFLVAFGLFLLWSGRYVWRGFRFVGLLIIRNVREAFNRLLQSKPIKAGLFRASMV